MNKPSQIILGSLITLSSLFGSVPEVKADTHEEHREIWSALQEVGIDTIVNHPDLCGDDVVDGAYINRKSTLIVCQDNAHRFSSKEVNWTENDYDTLLIDARWKRRGVPDVVYQVFNTREVKTISNHHDNHAYCAYYQSPYREALIVSYDGGGDGQSFNFYYMKEVENIGSLLQESKTLLIIVRQGESMLER